ncbi:MAG: hypothetical protein HY913_02190 [Desulfomonile tiedjei]|nr:hypothetical protein [Desulfomonile tiedjei]
MSTSASLMAMSESGGAGLPACLSQNANDGRPTGLVHKEDHPLERLNVHSPRTGALNRFALVSLITVVPAYSIDRMISRTSDWKDLHGRGGAVRMFYLANGAILFLSVMLFG